MGLRERMMNESEFKAQVDKLSSKNQYLLWGLIKDLLHISKTPNEYHPLILKERSGRKI